MTPTSDAPQQASAVRRVGRHTAIYAVGTLLSKAVAVVMLPLYTRYLSTADYGVIQLIDMTLDVIAIVAGSRLAAGVFHLYHKTQNEDERRALLGTAFAMLAGAFVLAGIAAWLSAPLIARLVLGDAALAPFVRIASLSLAFQSLLLIPMAEVQLREESRLFVGIGLAKLVVQITLNIVLLVGFGMGTRGVLIAVLAANAATGIPLGVRFLRREGLHVSAPAARDILKLGLPFIGVQLAKFVQTFGDRYFLRVAANTAAVGLYGLGYQFGFLLASIGFAPFIRAWEPLRFEIARRPDRDAIFNRVFVLLNVILLSAAVGITLFVGDFLRLATTPPFYAAAEVVPLVLVAYVAQSWSGFHNFGLFVGERTELITRASWIGAFIALALYALLIPRYHAFGAAWATLISFVVYFWLVYRSAQRVYPIGYEWGPTRRLSLIGVAVCTVARVLPDVALFWSVAIHAGLFTTHLVLVWHARVLDEQDKERLRRARFNPRRVLAALAKADT